MAARRAAVLVAACGLHAMAAAVPLSLTSGAIHLSLNPATFAFNVSMDGEAWFTSDDYSFSSGGTHSLAGGTLRPVGAPVSGSGVDGAGAYSTIALSWARTTAGASTPRAAAEWVTTFKAYGGNANRSALVFQQHWPAGVQSAAGGSAFPSLKQAEGGQELGTLEYTGSSCGFMVAAHGSYPGIQGGRSKGYIVIAPRDKAGTGASTSAAIGPVTEHFANQAHNGGDSLDYGMAPTFEFVPAGFTIETVLVASSRALDGATKATAAKRERASTPSGGVNAALFEYGDFVLSRHNKTRAQGDHNTETEYLGYSTTAFYFYNLCDCVERPAGNAKTNGVPDAHNRQTCSKGASPIPARFLAEAATPGVCGSYADTLIAVNAALKEQGIPIKHFLLDSWWYGEGWNGGASLWEDVPQCTGNDTSLAPAVYPAATFPKGLKAFHATVGLDKSIWVHNGKWTSGSPYREKYEFTHQDTRGPPQGRALWDHLFSANKQWGLGTIKQDHIGEQMGFAGSFTNVTTLKSWFTGMGEGAAANDVGVLYCCAPPNVHMNGVTVPAAYAVRASPDYVWGAGGRPLKLPTVQWAIGPDSAFHWNGLGLLPYKDTFISNATSTQQSGSWTTDPKQWPPFKGYHERNAATHALMSLFSTASVTFGDAVGQSNKTLLMRLVREDGMLLKPDRPATAVDAQFQAMMFGGWPGSMPPPPPPGPPTPGSGHGQLSVQACDAGNGAQRFVLPPSGGLRVSGANKHERCLDVSGCKKGEGAAVHVYNNTLGECGTHSSCHGSNEQWALVPAKGGGASKGQVAIVSALSKLCLRVDDQGGSLVTCDAKDPTQAWVVDSDFPHADKLPGFRLRTTATTTLQCLTAHDPTTAKETQKTEGAFEWPSDAAMEARAEELFPTRPGGLSAAYRNAYATSHELMAQIDARRDGGVSPSGERCEGRAGAPQGPLGEVYTTHVSVPYTTHDGGTGGPDMTWRYVVGVQLSQDYNVSLADLAIDSDGDSLHVSYAFDDFSTFKPTSPDDFTHLGAAGEGAVALKQSDGAQCETSPTYNISTRCFPFQLHAVAPVAPNGWALTGEVGKFVPVARARISKLVVNMAEGFTLTLRGSPGELVTMGAANVRDASAPVYATVAIGPDGTATLAVPPATGSVA